MQAAVYLGGVENIKLQDVPDPVAGPGEALLRVEACNVCGVDLRTWRHGDKKIEPPRILGHEFCAVVEENRAENSDLKKGDRVLMYIVLPCGACRWCQAGRANLCVSRSTMSYQHDGAFASHVRVPAAAMARQQLIKIESDLPSEQLALAEPLACVIHAHQRLAINLNDTVAVIGAGPIGVMHALVARLSGAQRVYLLDTSAPRLKIAEGFGFDGYIVVKDKAHLDEVARLTGGQGPSVVIVACGVASAQADALEMAGKFGRVEFFGGLPKSKPEAVLNSNHLHYKELQVTGSYSENLRDFQAASAMILGGRFPAAKLVTHQLPLAELHKAFDLMESGAALKVSMRP